MLKVAAEMFEINPRPGTEGRTLLANKTAKVFTPLKSSIVLIEQYGKSIVLLTSHLMTHYYRFSNILRRRVADVMGIDCANILVFSSHNHCAVKLVRSQYSFGLDEHDLQLPESELTEEGAELLAGYLEAASNLAEKLQPVTVRYGLGHERRISHNRKGRRADGSTYFMREEDRLKLGADFNGHIDDDAMVVGFYGENDQPVTFVTQFTAHPVTAFHCDRPIVHGEFSQVACDDLSEAFGGVPVAFLQGCAGDTNSKGLLSEKPAEESVRDAEMYGHQLGETFVQVAQSLTESTSDDLGLIWQWVELPFKDVAPANELRERLAAADEFLDRCDAGDEEGTLLCDGLNFPTTMSVTYRRALIEPIKRWLEWALAFHVENRLQEAPRGVRLLTAAVRIGDVGIVGMPCEPFLGIGQQIKQHAPTKLTIPCGYMNDTSFVYVPDGPNCDDNEFMSQFCKYTTTMLPYRRPAGDLLGEAGVNMLQKLYETPNV